MFVYFIILLYPIKMRKVAVWEFSVSYIFFYITVDSEYQMK